MAIKVHGVMMSPAVMRVVACLYEKELDFELVPVNMKAGDHKKEPFISLNPFGQIPALEDGDLTLFESRAINQYISRAYAEKGAELIPEAPDKAGLAQVWMEVESQKFEPVAFKLTWELRIKPFFGMIADDSVVEEYQEKLSEVLDVYEARLAQSKYLAGECFTLADLNHIPCIFHLMDTKAKEAFTSRPHVSAWCADILARPSWSKVAAALKN